MPINLPGVPFKLTAQDMGGFDVSDALSKGFNLNKQFQEARTMPKKLAEELLAAQLQNKINQPKADYAKQITLADLANTQANTGLTNQNSYKQQILNKYLPEREPAEIGEIKARGKYYENGGSTGGVGQKDYQSYVQGVIKDNPDLTPEQHQEAIDVIAKGGAKLKDGTPLNPMSFGTQNAFDRAVKSTTTANQLNTLNSANQAESELDVFTNLANKMRAPYSTTIFGKSPQQIADSFKNDDASQTQLGKLIAANALEFDIAQARNRVAMGAPGITSTNQMMDEAKQHIALYGPRLSGKAREVANEELNKALKEGLNARNKAGFGAGNLYQRQFKEALKNENPNSKANTDAFVNQMSQQLIQINPNATPENIKHTAELRKITPEQVIKELLEKSKRKNGGQ